MIIKYHRVFLITVRCIRYIFHRLLLLLIRTTKAVINEPTWMITLAYITTTTIISRSKMSRILSGLCRLHAHRIRNNVSTRGHSRTITFILPGQACVPSILPSIVDAFPHERHVFVYDGCVRSVVSSSSSTNINAVVEVGSIPSYITSSTPLSTSTLRNNLGGGSGGREKYDVLLSQLSVNVACVVETWMASVDTFLRVKTEEKGPDAEDIIVLMLLLLLLLFALLLLLLLLLLVK